VGATTSTALAARVLESLGHIFLFFVVGVRVLVCVWAGIVCTGWNALVRDLARGLGLGLVPAALRRLWRWARTMLPPLSLPVNWAACVRKTTQLVSLSRIRTLLRLVLQALLPAAGCTLPPRALLPRDLKRAMWRMVLDMFHRFCVASLNATVTSMMQSHTAARDVCLVGGKGSGKSAVARLFAARLGYPTELFSVYKDMTARDLLQRRSTDAYVGQRWPDPGRAIVHALCPMSGSLEPPFNMCLVF